MSTFLTIFGIGFLGAMSPGPDLIVVMKNAINRGRIHGIASALGVGSAIIIHCLIIGIGLGAIIETSVLAYKVIKIGGAVYLLYLAYSLITNKSGVVSESEIHKDQKKHSLLSSYFNGILTNILNPKFLVFIIALFAQMFGSETTINTYLLAGVSLGAAASIWFSLVSCLINWKHIKQKINSLQGGLQKVFGAILGALGLKILLE